LEIESHEKAMEIKKTLENILEEKSDWNYPMIIRRLEDLQHRYFTLRWLV
jgi:hypothetical protein